MKTSHKLIGAFSLILALSACGKSAPSKSEVSEFIKHQAFEQATQAQGLFGNLTGNAPMSDEKKTQIRNQIDKNIQIEGVKCKAVEGFNNVYDCNVSAVVQSTPMTPTFRFTRKSDGTLVGQEKTGD